MKRMSIELSKNSIDIGIWVELLEHKV